MPRVRFITTGHSHLAGNFSDGDFFTGGEAECRHFVEDARCAVWDEVQASGQSDEKPADEKPADDKAADNKAVATKTATTKRRG